MEIRPATERDAQGVWEVHTRAIRETCSVDYNLEQLEAWAGPRKPTDYLGPIREEALFVAVISGQIAGFGEYQQKRGEICAIYVHPNHGRKGIGRALFRRVVGELKLRGIQEAWLDASVTSVPFYLAMGCQQGEQRMHQLQGDVSIPCVRMTVAF